MQTTVENNAIVTIVSASGIEKTTADYIKENFQPFLDQAKEWNDKAKELVVTDVTQVKEMKLAREARLALKEIRVLCDKKRKALKEDSIRYGKAVQDVYNLIESVISPTEKYLQEQEDFKAIQEAKIRAELKAKRDIIADPLREFIPVGLDFGSMSEDDFEKLITGAKMMLDARILEQKKAEEERLQKEKEQEQERQRIREENEILKKQAEEKDKIQKERSRELQPYIMFIRDYSDLINKGEDEYRKQFEEIKKGAEDHWEYERKEQIRKQKEEELKEQERKHQLELLNKQREENQKIADELKAKKDAEEKAAADKAAAIEAELSKGDAEKMQTLIKELGELPFKYTFKSKNYQSVHKSIIELVEKTTTYATSKLK